MNELVKLGKADAKGNYKRGLGWKVQDRQYVRRRFYVGKDRTAAMLWVERLWDAIETAWSDKTAASIDVAELLGVAMRVSRRQWPRLRTRRFGVK